MCGCSAAADPGRSLCPVHREAKRASAERQRTKRALQRMPTSTTWVVAVADDVADADDVAQEYHPRPVDWGALERPTASRCWRCGTRALASLLNEPAHCLACGADPERRRAA